MAIKITPVQSMLLPKNRLERGSTRKFESALLIATKRPEQTITNPGNPHNSVAVMVAIRPVLLLFISLIAQLRSRAPSSFSNRLMIF
jgi:hypothetical protein